MKYSDSEISKVRSADIRLFVEGADQTKTSQDITCPFCGAKKKFRVSVRKGFNNAKCWACGEGFSGPIEAYAHANNIDVRSHYLECIEGVAKTAGIFIQPEKEVRRERIAATKKTMQKTFARQQLEGSGLEVDDIMATVVENNQETTLCPIRPGTIGPNFTPDTKGDDMLLFYYDLYGRPVQYPVKGSRTLRNYVRVRYANPELHTTDSGEAPKYKTPPGAPSVAWIPEAIRKLFKSKTPIETLFLQEGEKKAEKACRHGMLSIGLQGIMNIGSRESGLLQSIQDIVRICQVRNIVLVMDSDWNELSRNITVGDRADKRPNTFACAVTKFNQFMKSFQNMKINIDVWWAHVNGNDNGDKGVDDLLVGSLKGREDELMEDIRTTMNSHDGKGKWLDIHKITALSDSRIRDFWSLNDWNAFFEVHKARLSEIPTFKLGGVRFKVENDKLVPISRYSSDVDIFSIEEDSKGKEKVQLNYTETFRFLEDSGFKRLSSEEEGVAGYDFIYIDNGIVERTAPFLIRDFIRRYIMSNCTIALVREYFLAKLDVLLPDKKLEALSMTADIFNGFEADKQKSYYNNGMVEITSRGIVPEQAISNVWRSRIVARNFRRKKVIDWIECTGDYFAIQFTPDGLKSDFVRYIINTSNNYYTHDNVREITQDERYEWDQNIVNKITAIGYLLCDWKYPTDTRAVVIQDHKISEVGQSWGGAGKSILGYSIGKVTAQKVFDGKKFDPKGDFVLGEVTRATRNIFIDDIRTNFNFQSIFNWITGDLEVNPKGRTPFVIKKAESPKMLLTTNHAIKDADQGSVKRRIAYVEFSAWYNQDYTPVEEFGHALFDEWDEEQWVLFDNFMAECVMYYLRSYEMAWVKKGQGVVPPPMRNIELRTLRQSMGETLLQWADEFFDPTGENINRRISRKDMWNSFIEFAGGMQGLGVTRAGFKRKLIDFCKYKGYHMNINKPCETSEGKICFADWIKQEKEGTFIGADDKSNSQEYIMVYCQPDRMPKEDTQENEDPF